MIVAIDGPAASGKGTLGRRLAAHLGYDYLDTGALYRGAAVRVFDAGGDPGDPGAAVAAARALTGSDLDDPRLRDEAVGAAASRLAAMPPVREALLAFQQEFAAHPPGGVGAVLDGRDIGTVVCPHAEAKLFVEASLDVRARRRAAEIGAGEDAEADILADMRARDARDRDRGIAPAVAAADAFLLDTTDLDIDSAFAAAEAFVSRRLGRRT